MDQIVRVNLIIKADSFKEAEKYVRDKITPKLIDWFTKDAREEPPYSQGSLLHYSVVNGRKE